MTFHHGGTLFEDHTHPASLTLPHTHPGLSTPSATFPTSPREGDLFYETDTDKLWAYNGTAWVEMGRTGAWTDYTPTNTNITVGNGTEVARWTRDGRRIYVQYRLTLGTTTAFAGSLRVGLPVAAVSGLHLGSAWYSDTGTRVFSGTCTAGTSDSTSVDLWHTESGNAGQVNGTNPHSWAATDHILVAIVYEAAAST